MKVLALASLATLLLAGCLGVQPEDASGGSVAGSSAFAVPTGPTVVTGADRMAERLTTPRLSPNGGEVAAWELTYEAVVLDLEATLTWLNATNRFSLEVTTPSGATETTAAPADLNARTVEADIKDLSGGTYRFAVRSGGVAIPDKVTLEVRYKRVAEAIAGETITDLPVQTKREGAHWIATIAYSATGAVGESAEADVRGANGVVAIGKAADAQAVLNMVAWARADSEEDAIERVRGIDVSLRLASDRIEGHGSAESWNNRGVHVGLYVPAGTTLTGAVDSSNGPVEVKDVTLESFKVSSSNGPMEFHGVVARDLTGDTSNGPISGEVRAAGTLHLDTSNGPFELTVRPTDDLQLVLDTSNGPVDLQLEERRDVAYDLDVGTSNGRIKVEMEEASYQGDKTDGRVRTNNGAGRDVQVTGTVDTSNGPVTIRSA